MHNNTNFQPLRHLAKGHSWSGTEEQKKLILDMLRVDPAKRPSIGEVANRLAAIEGKGNGHMFLYTWLTQGSSCHPVFRHNVCYQQVVKLKFCTFS